MAFKRDSKFELLRIISMTMIILCHFSGYGNWVNNHGLTEYRNFIFQPLGQIGVYLFVMISGYFLSGRQVSIHQEIQRVRPLWIKTIYYSWLVLLISFILKIGGVQLNIKNIFVSAFPVCLGAYWFMTCFIVLMLLLPIINQVINKSTQKEFIFYILLIIIVGDIFPIVRNSNAPFGGTLSVAMLLSPYLIAAYIKKYNINITFMRSLMILLFGLIIQYLMMFILTIRNHNPWKFNFGILPLIVATGIFLIFLNLKSFYNKIINFLASSVLAAYLLTTHPVTTYWFNQDFINIGKFQNSPYLLIIEVVLAIVTVIVCCLIDKIYIYLFDSIKRLRIEKGRK